VRIKEIFTAFYLIFLRALMYFVFLAHFNVFYSHLAKHGGVFAKKKIRRGPKARATAQYEVPKSPSLPVGRRRGPRPA
jgi:hypothetical protein